MTHTAHCAPRSRRNLALGLLLAIAATACTPEQSTSARLQRVSELLKSGKLGEARSLANTYRKIDLRYLDPTDPRFCTAEGVRERVESQGDGISRALADSSADENPIQVYSDVLSARDRVKEVGDAVGTLCVISQVELSLAYQESVRGLFAATSSVLTDIRFRSGNLSEQQFAAALRVEQQVSEAEGSKAFKQRCKHLKGGQDELQKLSEDNEGVRLALKHLQSACRIAGH